AEGQRQTEARRRPRTGGRGHPLPAAIDRPRWLPARTWGSVHTNLRVEPRFDENLPARLSGAGHDVAVVEPYSDTMGHAGAVVLHPTGLLEGAHDPRADGGAAGV